jgi:Spy/CpxP family protein refolding chaperone
MEATMDNLENTTPRKPWKRRSAIAGIALAAVSVAGLGFYAVAKDGPDGGPMGHMGGHHGFMQKAKGDFMEYRMSRMLDAVDATGEQKQKITAIFEKARDSVSDMRGGPGQMRGEMKAILDKPTIDRDAVEAMRKERMQKMDDASKIMTTAMIDAAEVLTPDQRARLAKDIAEKADGHRPRW